jgi:hypothetical protein
MRPRGLLAVTIVMGILNLMAFASIKRSRFFGRHPRGRDYGRLSQLRCAAVPLERKELGEATSWRVL